MLVRQPAPQGGAGGGVRTSGPGTTGSTMPGVARDITLLLPYPEVKIGWTTGQSDACREVVGSGTARTGKERRGQFW
ncbi:hypothetical protein HIM_10047 [Hirsutella minnesotensis 3608]|uniref:Uncharacterized protein n=1 Tax=Hirsutella minnesotensis 3608 TaxID=1043627 RepID=A0A0F8A2P1_9HYPO|nr:hypothetical protein HIM_10047 [Hirsutella minnesotensis 3608]